MPMGPLTPAINPAQRYNQDKNRGFNQNVVEVLMPSLIVKSRRYKTQAKKSKPAVYVMLLKMEAL